MATAKRVTRTAMVVLGAVLVAIFVFDFIGYRLIGEQRYCVVTVQPVTEFEGAGTFEVEIKDTGSGCVEPVSVCRRSRILLSDVTEDC